jgi:hypothetical protein
MPIAFFINLQRVADNQDSHLPPCHLIFAALCVHAQRSRQPPLPLPPYMQVQFPALQLQRFLRSCVLATAHALVMPPASVYVHAKDRRCWFERIFGRDFRVAAECRSFSCSHFACLQPAAAARVKKKMAFTMRYWEATRLMSWQIF